jgi:hypothetical protein
MKRFMLALAALSLVAGSAGPALASPCKDKQGKFVKCPPKPTLCRNANGHFAKCPKLCRDKNGHFASCHK